MKVRIASHVLEEIRRHCAAEAPDEACGLLLGSADCLLEAIPARNIASERRRRFEIDPVALFNVHRMARLGGRAIVGCYHSHPDGIGIPSAEDASRALDLEWVWIIATASGERAFRVAAGGGIEGRFDECSLYAEG